MEAASNLVIKVKYGDVLRRFNARVFGDKLDIDVDGLREKISSLFGFSLETEFVLTYVDEDGDDVTLVDDSELCDVVKQALNPLRITVQLKAEKNNSQESGNLILSRYPHVQNSGSAFDLSDIRRTLEESMPEALVKLARDVALRVTSVPGVVDVLDSKTREQTNVTPEISTVVTAAKDAGLPKIDDTTSKVLKSEDKSMRGKEISKESQSEASMECSKMKSGDVTSFSKTSGPSIVFSSKTTLNAAKKNAILMARARLLGNKSQTNSSGPSGATNLFGGNNIPAKQAVKKVSVKPILPSYTPISPAGGMPCVPPHTAAKDFQFFGSNVVTHYGIQCDNCGVHPITGPRFNSTVKEDFDLCVYCYYKVGNDKDYIKIDYPGLGAYHTLQSSKNGFYSPQHFYSAPNIPHARVCGSALKIGGGSNLSSRFIRDVNVFDGTSLAPLTSFTKTWRMKNNGNIVWPKNTQLVWVGGDKLCNGISFELDIPDMGIAVDEELDISVDFISPESPGKYISYWRMASPYDQMFGQCVWVLIQVDASPKKIKNTVRNFNLNSLPTCNNDANGHDIEVDNLKPMVEDIFSHSGKFNNTVQSVQPLTQPNVEHENFFPINDSLLVGDGALSSVSSPNPNSVPYPNIGLSNVGSLLSFIPPPPPLFFSQPPRPDSVEFPKSPAQESPKEGENEEKLLRQLQNMGFKKVDLNKEILRLNGYDMVNTVDDLCGAQWDPMLKQLNEMGFTDKRMNKMLLEKNNGSIKRVVLDLISEGGL